VLPIVTACTQGNQQTVNAWKQRHDVLVIVCQELERPGGRSVRPGPSEPRPVPPRTVRMLRADSAAFTGREEEIKEISRTLNTGNKAGGVAIHAIDGMPGVGKTTLAVHVAHLLAERFPDGQIFVDLHGYSEDHPAADPDDVLASLLRYLDVPPNLIPDDPEERASRWRDRTAGRRLLLILDNAAHSKQVIPLIPGSGECLVLATSRSQLSRLHRDYGAGMLTLGIMSQEEAVALFRHVSGVPEGGAEEKAQEQAAAGLVQLCGWLPLAITILAGGVTASTSLADLVAALGAARDRLWEIDAQLGELESGVAAAFDLSYRELAPGDQQMLRLLSVTPGANIDVLAASALADLPPAATRRRLIRLRTARLIEPAGHDRFRLHDLIAQYASARTPPAEGDPACARLMDYYQRAAGLADRHLTRFTRPRGRQGVDAGAAPDLPDLSDRAGAYRWMTDERDNLLACIDQASARHEHARVAGLTAALAGYLQSSGPWAKAAVLHRAAAAAAVRADDVAGQGDALNDLGVAWYMAEEYPAAIAALEQAVGIYRDTGNRIGTANALNHLGSVRKVLGDLPGAAGAHEQALRIYRDAGDQLGEANALTQLGAASYLANEADPAATALRQAVGIYRVIGDQIGEANALTYLGAVLDEAGDYEAALDVLDQALDIHDDTENRIGRANVLNQMGATKLATGDHDGAIATLREALDIYRAIGNRISEANALNRLGAAQGEAGDHERALATLRGALDIYRETGNRLGQADVLSDLGIVHLNSGEYQAADSELQQALHIFGDLPDDLGQAQTLNRAGRVCLARGDPFRAETCHRRALPLARSVRSQTEEARAWEGIGRCAGARGSADEADAALRAAVVIFGRIGSPDARRLRDELGEST
jgi:tetratricopeptide (TPR) repeat protein